MTWLQWFVVALALFYSWMFLRDLIMILEAIIDHEKQSPNG